DRRLAQGDIDERHPLPGLGERDREIDARRGLAFLRLCRRDEDRSVDVVDLSEPEIRAQSTEGLPTTAVEPDLCDQRLLGDPRVVGYRGDERRRGERRERGLAQPPGDGVRWV